MKLKRLFSGLLVSLIAIVSVLLCVKVSNAEETRIAYASFYNEAKLSNKGGSNANNDYITGVFNNEGITVSGATNAYYDKKGGLGLGTSSKTGSFIINSSVGFNKVVIYGTGWNDSEKALVVDNRSADSGQLAAASTQLDKIDTPVVWEFTTTKTSITVATSSKRAVIFTIELLMSESTATTYNVSFDANGATFATGKGEKITTAVGTDTTVTLPTIDDLVYGCKEIMPLSGWSDGTTTHKPGATVTVSEATKFTAVYSENNSKTLSVAEAIEVAKLVGKSGTTKEFKVTGIISAFDKDYPDTFTIVDETDNTKELNLYNPATKVADSKVVVGDKVIATGMISDYYSSYQLKKDCTYEKVVAPKPATAVEFEKVETMSSLSFDWATTDGKDYTFSNVSLRFGNLFTKDAYTEGATYGVLLIQNSDLAGADFATYLAEMTLEEITADTKIKNVEAIPVKVNAEGVADENGEYYQFAAVLSDMDEYLTTSITAVMYVVIDGQIYYSVEKTASVQSVADAYLDKYLLDELQLTDDEINVLEVLAK